MSCSLMSAPKPAYKYHQKCSSRHCIKRQKAWHPVNPPSYLPEVSFKGFVVYLLSTLYYLPKHRNTATHVAKGAFMSLLSLAYISEESPCRRSPGKPSRLMILSRLGGTMDMQRWKRPYPKLTAPFSLFRDSSDTPSATM